MSSSAGGFCSACGGWGELCVYGASAQKGVRSACGVQGSGNTLSHDSIT